MVSGTLLQEAPIAGREKESMAIEPPVRQLNELGRNWWVQTRLNPPPTFWFRTTTPAIAENSMQIFPLKDGS
jgi:hypothetical protein